MPIQIWGMMRVEQRLDRLEVRVDNLEKNQRDHEVEFAETRVYVREGYKKMDAISLAVEALKKTQGSEWKGFFEKGFWLIAGAVVAFIAGKIHF